MAHSDAEASPEATLRILIVEDEPLIRVTMSEALRELGVTVVEAASADEAWAYLATGPTVDLVFTDHRMPGTLSGAQLAARIRLVRPDIKVVVTSGLFDARHCWREPVLAKPYPILETAARLMALAGGNGALP